MSNPNFNPVYSTLNIWRNENQDICLEDELVEIETNIAEKAAAVHTHTAAEIGAATADHNHSEIYAEASHNHNAEYAIISHDHDAEYAGINHAHDAYALASHNHDADYAEAVHTHVIGNIAGLQDALDAKATTEFVNAAVGAINREPVTVSIVNSSFTTFTYNCYYYPALGMVFLRMYGVSNIDMESKTTYSMANITTRKPINNHALAVKCSNRVCDVLMSSAGNINVTPYETIPSGKPFYITGFWLVFDESDAAQANAMQEAELI